MVNSVKKSLLLSLLLSVFALHAFGQSAISNNGEISFFSEKKGIKGVSNSFTSKLDLTAKTIVFSVPIQSFTLPKAMMQKHFNQKKVMDSKTYPKAKFKGEIMSEANFQLPGKYKVMVIGEMTMHGVTKPFKSNGTITVGKDGKISAKSSFDVKREDFGIKGMYPSFTSKIINLSLMANYEME